MSDGNVVHLPGREPAHRVRHAGPVELRPELGNLVDETGRLEDVELEVQIRTYRSRRRRELAALARRRRERIEALIVGAGFAGVIAYIGSGAAYVWPQ